MTCLNILSTMQILLHCYSRLSSEFFLSVHQFVLLSVLQILPSWNSVNTRMGCIQATEKAFLVQYVFLHNCSELNLDLQVRAGICLPERCVRSEPPILAFETIWSIVLYSHNVTKFFAVLAYTST